MAQHPDYANSELVKIAVAPNIHVEGVEIVLSQGGRIEGLVDPSLGTLTDRQVDLLSLRGSIGWREARTDAAGRFVIENGMPQDYIIELRAPHYPELSSGYQPGIRKKISVRDGQTTQVLFGDVRRQILIHGTIVSLGAPAPGLKVRTYSPDSEDHGEECITGPDGHFELTVPGPGAYSFNVSSNQGSYTRFEQTVPDQEELHVLLEVPGGSLCGRILGSNGKPLRRVPITAVRSGWTDLRTFYRDHYRRMYTDDDGAFEFRLLASGSYTLRTPDGFQDDRPPPRVPYGRIVLPGREVGASQVSGIEMQLPPECRVSGVVSDAGGAPVTDAWIRLMNESGLSLSATWETQTDATGHFQVENVGAGTYSVVVRSGEREVTSSPFAVHVGETASALIEMP